jgi:hypothetical protein
MTTTTMDGRPPGAVPPPLRAERHTPIWEVDEDGVQRPRTRSESHLYVLGSAADAQRTSGHVHVAYGSPPPVVGARLVVAAQWAMFAAAALRIVLGPALGL